LSRRRAKVATSSNLIFSWTFPLPFSHKELPFYFQPRRRRFGLYFHLRPLIRVFGSLFSFPCLPLSFSFFPQPVSLSYSPIRRKGIRRFSDGLTPHDPNTFSVVSLVYPSPLSPPPPPKNLPLRRSPLVVLHVTRNFSLDFKESFFRIALVRNDASCRGCPFFPFFSRRLPSPFAVPSSSEKLCIPSLL